MVVGAFWVRPIAVHVVDWSQTHAYGVLTFLPHNRLIQNGVGFLVLDLFSEVVQTTVFQS